MRLEKPLRARERQAVRVNRPKDVTYPVTPEVEAIQVLNQTICYRCGHSRFENIHCKLICLGCRQLVSNCNGD
jgi:hypothetical protein